MSKTRIRIVLDRSGSMASMKTEMLNGLNEYIKQIKKDGLKGRLSLTIFDSHSVDTIRKNVKIKNVTPITGAEFSPRAATPLLDTVGFVLAEMKSEERKFKNNVLMIITDGQENSSHEYTSEQISKQLSKREQKDNWLITYMGANQDAWSVGFGLGLGLGKSLNFGKRGLMNAFLSSSSMTTSYAAGAASVDTIYTEEDEKKANSN